MADTDAISTSDSDDDNAHSPKGNRKTASIKFANKPKSRGDRDLEKALRDSPIRTRYHPHDRQKAARPQEQSRASSKPSAPILIRNATSWLGTMQSRDEATSESRRALRPVGDLDVALQAMGGQDLLINLGVSVSALRKDLAKRSLGELKEICGINETVTGAFSRLRNRSRFHCGAKDFVLDQRAVFKGRRIDELGDGEDVPDVASSSEEEAELGDMDAKPDTKKHTKALYTSAVADGLEAWLLKTSHADQAEHHDTGGDAVAGLERQLARLVDTRAGQVVDIEPHLDESGHYGHIVLRTQAPCRSVNKHEIEQHQAICDVVDEEDLLPGKHSPKKHMRQMVALAAHAHLTVARKPTSVAMWEEKGRQTNHKRRVSEVEGQKPIAKPSETQAEGNKQKDEAKQKNADRAPSATKATSGVAGRGRNKGEDEEETESAEPVVPWDARPLPSADVLFRLFTKLGLPTVAIPSGG